MGPRSSRRSVLALLAVVLCLLAGVGVLGGAAAPSASAAEADRAAQADQADQAAQADQADEAEGPTLVYFRTDSCPVCTGEADPWITDLAEERPELDVRRVNVEHDPQAQQVFVEMMERRGEQAGGVPAFVLGDEAWVGLTDGIRAEIDGRIDAALADPGDEPADPDPDQPAGAETLSLGPLGTVDLAAQPMLAATALIGFVDGFNPCSLWVLTVLLAMVLHSGSRGRIAAVGGTFLVVTAAIYGLFIAGVFTVLGFAEELRAVQIAVAVLALGFAAISIKDFLAFKQGLSLSIPDRFKPRIYRGGRELRRTDRSLPALLGLTVVFAAGIAVVELPCTAGFPLVWSGLVADAGIGTLSASFLGLLGTYLAVYLLVEIAILVGALVTLRATRLQEVHGRYLKLIGGTVMAAIAVVLLVDPSLMESITGSFGVVGAALAVAAAAIAWDRQRTQPSARV